LQWREKVFDPWFEAKPDQDIMYLFAKKFGFDKEMFKHIEVKNGQVVPEDILRELNRGSFACGYTGQSPERLKMHMAHQKDFDRTTLRAKDGPAAGDFYGLPWPCWGTAEIKHPGTPLLYDYHKSVQNGGLTFRARFGVERNGENILADGAYSVDSEIKDGYPEFTMAMLKKLGWDKDLTPQELATVNAVGGDKANWKTDISGGIQRVAIKHNCAPFGNAKARTVVWNFPDPVPLHREPIYSPRRDLVKKYPTYSDRKEWRLPTLYASLQKVDHSKQFPTILTSGRLVEYEGGGEETRSNPWLAELQQEMFIEINPADAAARGIKDGGLVWVTGAENGSKAKVTALVTERVGKGVAWMPMHFGGWFGGVDLRRNYPQGADPYVIGESANTITTYGYDASTGMQEPKVTLCQIRAA
jgi:formate dehydrogenase major subunit